MCGGIYDARMGPYPPWVALATRSAASQRSASGVVVSTPYGTASTGVNTVVTPRVLMLWTYVRVYFSKNHLRTEIGIICLSRRYMNVLSILNRYGSTHGLTAVHSGILGLVLGHSSDFSSW